MEGVNIDKVEIVVSYYHQRPGHRQDQWLSRSNWKVFPTRERFLYKVERIPEIESLRLLWEALPFIFLLILIRDVRLPKY